MDVEIIAQGKDCFAAGIGGDQGVFVVGIEARLQRIVLIVKFVIGVADFSGAVLAGDDDLIRGGCRPVVIVGSDKSGPLYSQRFIADHGKALIYLRPPDFELAGVDGKHLTGIVVYQWCIAVAVVLVRG